MPLLFAIGAATFEEPLFRGVIFRIAEDWLGSYWALALSALLFGAAHLGNATLLAGVAIMIDRIHAQTRAVVAHRHSRGMEFHRRRRLGGR